MSKKISEKNATNAKKTERPPWSIRRPQVIESPSARILAEKIPGKRRPKSARIEKGEKEKEIRPKTIGDDDRLKSSSDKNEKEDIKVYVTDFDAIDTEDPPRNVIPLEEYKDDKVLEIKWIPKEIPKEKSPEAQEEHKDDKGTEIKRFPKEIPKEKSPEVPEEHKDDKGTEIKRFPKEIPKEKSPEAQEERKDDKGTEIKRMPKKIPKEKSPEAQEERKDDKGTEIKRMPKKIPKEKSPEAQEERKDDKGTEIKRMPKKIPKEKSPEAREESKDDKGTEIKRMPKEIPKEKSPEVTTSASESGMDTTTTEESSSDEETETETTATSSNTSSTSGSSTLDEESETSSTSGSDSDGDSDDESTKTETTFFGTCPEDSDSSATIKPRPEEKSSPLKASEPEALAVGNVVLPLVAQKLSALDIKSSINNENEKSVVEAKPESDKEEDEDDEDEEDEEDMPPMSSVFLRAKSRMCVRRKPDPKANLENPLVRPMTARPVSRRNENSNVNGSINDEKEKRDFEVKKDDGQGKAPSLFSRAKSRMCFRMNSDLNETSTNPTVRPKSARPVSRRADTSDVKSLINDESGKNTKPGTAKKDDDKKPSSLFLSAKSRISIRKDSDNATSANPVVRPKSARPVSRKAEKTAAAKKTSERPIWRY